MDFCTRFGGSPSSDGAWNFELGEELNGGFGGTNGGVLAALSVYVARQTSPERHVAGADARFIRGFRPGLAVATPTVVNAGRTLTTVSVDITSADGKLCARTTVSLVSPKALADVSDEEKYFSDETMVSYAEGKPWRQPRGPQVIPLIDTFDPRQLSRGDNSSVTGSRIIWNDPLASAEAACIAADISVGPPVAMAVREKGIHLATPNPDLSLRFSGNRATTSYLTAHCNLASLTAGLAMTRLEVRSAGDLLAVGISTTTCFQS